MVHLNVGGLILSVRRVILESLHQETLANLFDGEWDSRVPRDKDGRIFLDESPLIVKLLQRVQDTTWSNVRAYVISPDVTTPALNVFADDQLSYLTNAARVFGLRNSLLGKQAMGVSTVLKDDELDLLSVTIHNWCPGDPRCLELIYRGSRDGLKRDAFFKCCTEDSPSTITLIKVNYDSYSDRSSVIGGFSSVPWDPERSFSCPNAFIFVVKDDSTTGEERFQPVKWLLPRQSSYNAATYWCKRGKLGFGDYGFTVSFKPPCSLHLGQRASPLPIILNKKEVAEIEVYRVCHEPGVPIVSFTSDISNEGKYMATTGKSSNFRLFGGSIASVFMKEKIALLEAQAELALAEKNAEAAACALAVVYGPDIASGKSDAVVELNVRGTKMITLRSTLQACRESALAARFDESKWLSDGTDFGLIDCDPSSFSKVLDVLRMRKRENWSHRASVKGLETSTSHVTVTAEDRVPFEEFVGMYFPGCEGFVMDAVKFRESSDDV